MRIVFISHLSASIAAGLSWSVPARVKAQELIDNVLWIDSAPKTLPHWLQVKSYHRLEEYGQLSLQNFPKPFNKPDVVIFEGFYCRREVRFAKELRKNDVPYIIVPRGSLTHQARHNRSRFKKMLAHWLWFDGYVKNAMAVQYLTEAERNDSSRQHCKRSFVLSNGFNQPSVMKSKFSAEGVKAVFIGRLDIYHKGLDVLLLGLRKQKEELRRAKFMLDIYGPFKQDHEKLASMIVQYGIDDMVCLKGGVSGKDKEQALLQADVFVLTSRFEGHPMGLIEALAYGVPALVTPGSNMSEEIENENAGWVTACDADSVGETLLKMVHSHGSFPIKGGNAQRLSRRYSWDVLAEKMHELLDGMLQEQRK